MFTPSINGCLIVVPIVRHLSLRDKTILDENQVNEAAGWYLREGDILVDPDEIPVNGTLKYAAVIGKRWPNPVPYEFSPEMKANKKGVQGVMAAIEQYHKYTCIRFKPRTTEDTYMNFKWSAGCASFVGMRPGKANNVHLATYCFKPGLAIHEMGHSLGLYHEQSRPDRNKYVEILYDNIKEQFKFAFDIEKDVDDLGTPYDYGSIMHYGTSDYSIGGRSIRTIDYSKRLLLGNREGFSNKDVQILNLMYNCPVYKGTVPPKVCKDTGAKNCAYEKKHGHCHYYQYEREMYLDCCKTCFGNVAGKLGEPKTWPPTVTWWPFPQTTSKPTPPGPCKDKASKSQCDYWLRMGYCKSSTTAIRRMAIEKCCATCKAHE